MLLRYQRSLETLTQTREPSCSDLTAVRAILRTRVSLRTVGSKPTVVLSFLKPESTMEAIGVLNKTVQRLRDKCTYFARSTHAR